MNTAKLMTALIVAGFMVLGNIDGAVAQTQSPHQMMSGNAPSSPGSMPMHLPGMSKIQGNAMPTLPGQDAFGAIQEIVSILEADPSTNWSRVDIGTLRAHLLDMNLLVLDTVVDEKPIDGGLEMVVTGQGRTRQAILSTVPAHAPMIDGMNGWEVTAEVNSSSATLTVTSTDAKDIARIRGLGFYGLMVLGSHHQIHHLGLARGDNVHAQ